MKSWKKFLIISLSLLFVVTSIFAGLSNFGNVSNNTNKNSNNNQESGVVTPTEPDNTYGGMVYYASESEDSGASVVPKEMKGGAIYVGENTTIDIDGGTIHNHEGLYGGAIYIANGGTVNMSGGSIEYNYSKYGGAFYIEAGGKLNLTGGTIVNNKAENAPAIYAENGSYVKISANVDIDTNDYITYNDTIINFYVDGKLSDTVYQGAPTLNLSNVPLDYENCCGYFFNEEMTESVEQGDDLTLLENNNLQTVNSNGYLVYNLYTRTATLDKLTFKLIDDNHYIVNAKNTLIEGDVVIPKMVGSYYVTETYYNHNVNASFYNCKNITNVYCSSSIKTIGNSAFSGCTKLNNINLPDSITKIGDGAFQGCTELEEIVFPKNITSIGAYAFESCLKLKEITLLKTITSIGNYAFIYCKNVEVVNYCTNTFNTSCNPLYGVGTTNGYTLNIDNEVTVLPQDAFRACDGIKNVNFLSNNIQTLNTRAFAYCFNLENITLPNSITEIGTSVFFNCSDLREIILPDSVITIGQGAFTDCSSLTEITLSKAVTTISGAAFQRCTALEEIVLESNNLKTIEGYLFDGCSSLTKVVLPDSITTIGSLAFNNCVALEEIVFPKNITSIGDYAYQGCLKLTEITLPSSITSFGTYVFNNCSNVEVVNYNTNSFNVTYKPLYRVGTTNGFTLNIGNAVTALPQYAFKNCDGIKNVNFLSNNLKTINDGVFMNCKNVEKITLSNSITAIGNSTFAYCDALTEIILSDSLITVADYVFQSCTSLEEIVLTNNVTSLGMYSFDGCEKLENITVPSSITRINYCAFNNCESLKNVYIESLNNWVMIDFVHTNSNPLYFADNLYLNNELVTSFDLEYSDGITMISNFAFYGYDKLISVKIPKNVVTVGQLSFIDCVNLETVIFEEGSLCENINGSAFKNCTLLTSITLPTNLKKIRTGAFDGSNITEVVIPASCRRVGRYAFGDALEKITFADTTGWYLVCETTDGSGYVYCEPVTVTDNATNISNYSKIHDTVESSDAYPNYYYFEKDV